MSNVSIRPLHDRIVIKPLEEENKTSGGIYLPDAAKEKPARGEVIAIGSGKRLENGEVFPVGVVIGDKVVYSKYAGTEVKLEDEQYLVLREEDVMAVIEG